MTQKAIENTFLLEKEESEQIADCASGIEAHTYQIEDFSGTDDGYVRLVCEVCGYKKRS